MELKKMSMKTFGIIASLSLIAILGCGDMSLPPEEGSEPNPDLSVGEPALSPATVPEGQNTEFVNISVRITRIDGANEDAVRITGDMSSVRDLALTASSGVWSGTIYPDASASVPGDTLAFTVTATDTTNGITKTRAFNVSVVEAIPPDISIGVPTLGTTEVSEGQSSELVTISVQITRIDGGKENSVKVSGDSIDLTYLAPTYTPGEWTGSFTPDATLHTAGDILTFTITATDTPNGITKILNFTLTVKAAAATDAA